MLPGLTSWYRLSEMTSNCLKLFKWGIFISWRWIYFFTKILTNLCIHVVSCVSLQVSWEHEHCSDRTEESWAGRWLYTPRRGRASLTHLQLEDPMEVGVPGPGQWRHVSTAAHGGENYRDTRLQTRGARVFVEKGYLCLMKMSLYQEDYWFSVDFFHK